MTVEDAIDGIERLIETFGRDMSRDDYLEALNEMVDRAANAATAIEESDSEDGEENDGDA